MHLVIDSDAAVRNLPSASAQQLVTLLLRDYSDRLAHSRTAARRVARIACVLSEPWRSALPDAVLLHDIGYATPLVEMGHHAVDGARWLRRQGWGDEVARLVAWHTSSREEAALLHMADGFELEFAPPDALAASALTWADLTSSPAGDVWGSERRLADILDRHPVDSVVYRVTVAAMPALRQAVFEIESLLAPGAA